MTATYTAKCVDINVQDPIDTEQQVRVDKLKDNADKLANILQCDINIKSRDVGKNMLSYCITRVTYFGGLDYLSKRIGVKNSLHDYDYDYAEYDTPRYVGVEDLDKILDTLKNFSDHPQAIYKKNAKGNWVVIGHVSSPYIFGIDPESVKNTIQHAIDVLGAYFNHSYELIFLDKDNNIYYPADERIDFCVSIVIIDKDRMNL